MDRVVLPDIKKSLGLNNMVHMLLLCNWIQILHFYTHVLLAGPLSSALSHRFGIRLTVMTGGVLASLGFVVSSFATSVTFLYFTYGIIGGRFLPYQNTFRISKWLTTFIGIEKI